MCYEKDCYFCKNLCYLDINKEGTYVCSLTGKAYKQAESKCDCENFVEEEEEEGMILQ